jgi:competence protein ComEC
LLSKINIKVVTKEEGVSCDEAGCVAQMAGGAFVTLALRPLRARRADRDGATDSVRLRCAGDYAGAFAAAGRDDAAAGARRLCHAAKPRGFDRPWSPAIAGDGEAEPNFVRSVVPRAVDATPSEADLQSED